MDQLTSHHLTDVVLWCQTNELSPRSMELIGFVLQPYFQLLQTAVVCQKAFIKPSVHYMSKSKQQTDLTTWWAGMNIAVSSCENRQSLAELFYIIIVMSDVFSLFHCLKLAQKLHQFMQIWKHTVLLLPQTFRATRPVALKGQNIRDTIQ